MSRRAAPKANSTAVRQHEGTPMSAGLAARPLAGIRILVIDGADVLVYSMPPEKMAALGLVPDALRARNPKLVVTSRQRRTTGWPTWNAIRTWRRPASSRPWPPRPWATWSHRLRP